MKRNYKYLLLAVLFIFMSCEKKNELTPTEGLEPFYDLPQGDHDFDDRIMELHQKYGFYPLYIFEDKDLYWDYNNWSECKDPECTVKGDLIGKAAIPAYVNKQLNLLDDYFFVHFNESLLKNMPLKLLLCSELHFAKNTTVFQPDGTYILEIVKTPKWSDKRFGQIAINGGSEMIDTMTVSSKVKFAQSVAADFGKHLIEIGILVAPEEFLEVARPSYTYQTALYGEQLFEAGLLHIDVVSFSTTPKTSLKLDFDSYVQMFFGNTLAKLQGSLDFVDTWERNPTFGGALNPTRDVNGMVAKKYNIVVAYLKKMGIDVDFYQNPPQ